MSLCRTLLPSLICLCAAGCHISISGINQVRLKGSGKTVTAELKLKDFTRIEAGQSFHVDIRQGDKYQVVLEADDNIMELTRVDQNGERLSLGFDSSKDYALEDVTLRAIVTLPTLKSLDLNGAADARFDRFEASEPIDIDLSGASAISGQLMAGQVGLKLSGASTAKIEGSVDRLTLGVSGASAAKLGGLIVNRADVNASGASKATVHVVEKLDANASGASRIRYAGEPDLGAAVTSGAASIEPE